MYVSVIYVRNHKSIDLKNFFNRQKIADMERKATIIMCNPKFKRIAVITIAILLFYANPVLAASNPFDKIGWTFWKYIKGFGRFACLIMAAVEVIKSLMAGDTKSIAKILFKYIVAYATFTILPWIFDTIDKEFKL